MPDITRDELATALNAAAGGRWTVTGDRGEITGKLRYPARFAECVLGHLEKQKDESAESRFPITRTPPCPDCGMPHRPGFQHVGDPFPEPADEPEYEDAELVAIGEIIGAVETLNPAVARRVLRWACERYGVSRA
jgi:hypothetical protein